MSKYECWECKGKGEVEIHSPEGHWWTGCRDCGGTGKKRITIMLEEYERLQELEKNLSEGSLSTILATVFKLKLRNVGIDATVECKEYSSSFELLVLFDIYPDYNVQLKVCEIFSEMEYQFGKIDLNFIIDDLEK
jgi:hypothetical protein